MRHRAFAGICRICLDTEKPDDPIHDRGGETNATLLKRSGRIAMGIAFPRVPAAG